MSKKTVRHPLIEVEYILKNVVLRNAVLELRNNQRTSVRSEDTICLFFQEITTPRNSFKVDRHLG